LILQKILGLTCRQLPEEETVLTPEIQQLIAEREDARAVKDWARADAIRDQLKELGYQVQDKKTK
jgi:cysteinyl-tRNA synthetase